jgi:MFS superfamily sulfate permease-like transporter
LIKREQKRFAEREKFSIENNDNQTDNKLQQVKQVLHYYHRAILLFFKCNKIELAFIDSMNQGNTVSLESIRANLQKYTEQSLKNFDTMSAYNNDASLIKASTEALQFFESEAKDKFPILIDYYQKKGKFDRQAAAINNTAPQDRTQKMIDSYNANLNAINEMTDKYNSTNQELNTMRMAVVNKYNKTINDFFDRNTPKLK